VRLTSVSHARSLGIQAVYQDLALVDQLPVYLNLHLNAEPVHSPLPFMKRRQMQRRPGSSWTGSASASRPSTPRSPCSPAASARPSQ
jgi:ABC-type sugar transport system ATPase subunit